MKKVLLSIMCMMILLGGVVSVAAQNEPEINGEATALVEETVSIDRRVRLCGLCGTPATKRVYYYGNEYRSDADADCIHYKYGTDEVFSRSVTIYNECECGFIREHYDTYTEETRRVCHGYN